MRRRHHAPRRTTRDARRDATGAASSLTATHTSPGSLTHRRSPLSGRLPRHGTPLMDRPHRGRRRVDGPRPRLAQSSPPPRRPSEAHAGIPRAVHTHGRLVEHPYPESAAEAPPQRPLPRLRDRHEDVIATLGACARILDPRGWSCGPARSGRRDELWLGTMARSERRSWRGAKPSHVHGGPCFPPLTRAARESTGLLLLSDGCNSSGQ